MRDWTDDQFKAAGWKWVLRNPDDGRAIACTVSAFEAGNWKSDKVGTVIALSHAKEPT